MRGRLAMIAVVAAGVLVPVGSHATHVCNELNIATGVRAEGTWAWANTGLVGCQRKSAEQNTRILLTDEDSFAQPFVIRGETCNSKTPPTGPTIGSGKKKKKTAGSFVIYNSAGKVMKTVTFYKWGVDAEGRYVVPPIKIPTNAASVKLSAIIKGAECTTKSRSITAQVVA